MNIANNILKNGLKNVYFLVGTACGGKTTMAKEISKKYGFVNFSDNWHEPQFAVWQNLCDPKYQPNSSKRNVITDWEAYFSRSVEEFLTDREGLSGFDEYIEFMVIELIKISQSRKIIADLCLPIPLIAELADYDRIACLLAPGELIIRDYYDREDHIEFTQCIQRLKDPEKKFETQNELFRIGARKEYDDVMKQGLFHIMRCEDSTVEGTLKLLEEHFKLEDI